ncbi:MAG: type II secretion system protein GspG [Myxococcales bacterium]
MAKRARKRSPRLPLPWEREDSLLRGLFSGRRVLPFVLLAAFASVLGGAYWLGGRRADILSTRATLSEVSRATEAFVHDVGRCPRSLNELLHPPRSGVIYLHELPSDAWGNGVYLRCDGSAPEIEVLSAGPSGSFLDDDNVM